MRAPTWRGALGGCLGLVLLTLSPVAPASSSTYTVKMTGSMTFSPTSISVPLGSFIRWTNTSTIRHTATSNQAFFNTGYVTPGTYRQVGFPFAGTFRYHCIPHGSMGMTGSVLVRISAPNSAPDRFRLRWALDNIPLTNRTFDFQSKAPGGTWTSRLVNTKARYYDTWPIRTGTWQFRVRTDNTANATSSAWSPTKYVSVS